MKRGMYPRTEEHKIKMSKSQTERFRAHPQSEETRIKKGKSIKISWNNPSVRRARVNSRIGLHRSEMTKKKMSDAAKRRWSSPETKAKLIAAILKASHIRPNKFEVICLKYLNAIFDNSFKYTGDGSLIINHRSADAYSKKLNTIALFHGCHWHLENVGLEITEDNKRAVEKVDSLPFLSAGYKVVFIWEDEMEKIIQYITSTNNKEK